MHLSTLQQRHTIPDTPCNETNEGIGKLNSVLPNTMWICKSKQWIPYQWVANKSVVYAYN